MRSKSIRSWSSLLMPAIVAATPMEAQPVPPVVPLAVTAPSARPPQAVGTVTGLVTGTAGQPLSGASVAIAGTTRVARTDASGRYTVTGVPTGSRTVRATFAGYTEASRSIT